MLATVHRTQGSAGSVRLAGIRTPEPVLKLKDVMPQSYAQLLKVRQILEKHFKDVQDIEFTIQEGKLYMLQTRNGKRTAAAALKFAADMVKEKLIDWETAILRNPADQLEQLLAPIFDLAEVKKAAVIATGLPAGPGAATGKIYFNAERSVAAAEKGEKVLLVRVETSPEDLRGMIAAEGILTARGGATSTRRPVTCDGRPHSIRRPSAPWTTWRTCWLHAAAGAIRPIRKPTVSGSTTSLRARRSPTAPSPPKPATARSSPSAVTASTRPPLVTTLPPETAVPAWNT